MVNFTRINSVLLMLLLSCSTKELAQSNQIPIVEFTDFAENPKRYKGQDIGVKCYYVEGLPELYIDNEFYESVSNPDNFDSTKFDYLHFIGIPNYHKAKRPPTLTYLEGAYVIAYGRATRLDLANNNIRYGGYLLVDSIVLQKSH